MSDENVEIVKRMLWDGVDAVPIVRDDEALASWLAEIGPLLEPECSYSDRAEALEAAGLRE